MSLCKRCEKSTEGKDKVVIEPYPNDGCATLKYKGFKYEIEYSEYCSLACFMADLLDDIT